MKYLLAFLAFALALATVYGAFFYDFAPSVHRYENRTLGIAFSYPEGLALSESDAGAADEPYVITLVRDTETSLPEAGEGPTSVSIAVYPVHEETLYRWMKEAPASNFQLGSGSYASTTIGGQEAVVFAWSGLYEGETTACIHQDRIVAISGTVLSRDDSMREAYEQVRSTFELR